RRLYFDTVMFEPGALRFLCDTVGADKIMLGSDYPFGIGDPEPRRIVDETSLTEAERQAILGETAAHVFRIDCGCGSHRQGREDPVHRGRRRTECSKNFVWPAVWSGWRPAYPPRHRHKAACGSAR